MLIYHSWKNIKMPKIVEVGYIVAMPDTLQKDKHSTKPLPEPILMYIGWLLLLVEIN